MTKIWPFTWARLGGSSLQRSSNRLRPADKGYELRSWTIFKEVQSKKASITDSGSSSAEGLFCVSSGDRNERCQKPFSYISNTDFLYWLLSARLDLVCPGANQG